MELIFK